MVIVPGVALWDYHEGPEFCAASCHVIEDTQENFTAIVASAAAAGLPLPGLRRKCDLVDDDRYSCGAPYSMKRHGAATTFPLYALQAPEQRSLFG